ncbi:MAG: magnesium transporter CorA family protein [Candidatus Levybacteria bacterium]|nr:magnesium transporter CorA family protein [Candidatus Levybacteria bacterium]
MNVQSVTFQGLSFVNISKPTDFEIKFLKNTYYFNSLNLEDYMHKAQIPKIENHRRYDLIILRFPLFSENSIQNAHQYGVYLPTFRSPVKKRRLVSSYVNFFISKEYVVVLHDGDLSPINNIFSLCQKTIHARTDYMSKGTVFLAYKIIDALADNCFPVINEITSTIDRIDKELEEKQDQKTLENISTTRRNLVVFHTMLKPVLSIFKELEKGKHERLNSSMLPFWSNVLDHLQKIMDRLEDNQELIEGISSSNESFLMTRTNVIIKVLTIITVFIMPLNLLAGMYGMNIVGLPFAQHPSAFLIMVAVMISLAIPLLIIFKIKRWF